MRKSRHRTANSPTKGHTDNLRRRGTEKIGCLKAIGKIKKQNKKNKPPQKNPNNKM